MVNIIINSDPRYKVSKMIIQSAVVATLAAHGVNRKAEVEVSIVGDRKMHELNKTYRGIDSTTDILTFVLEDPASSAGFVSYPDNVLRLGSIVISHPRAIEDAAMDGKSLDEEMAYLVEHGCKHLLGIHHN
jgi:probable rRNA maturation factor